MRKYFIIICLTLVIATIIGVLIAKLGKRKPVMVESFPYIENKAKQLDYNIEKMLAYVKNEIKNEDYERYLRGPIGTFWSKAGNDIDKCSLLIELLKYANVKTKIIKDKEGYFIKYRNNGKWEAFYPVYHRKENQFEELNNFPEEIRHKLEITVRYYFDESGYKDDIRYKNDVAFFIDKKNVFKWEKGLKGALLIGDKIIKGSESVKKASKIVVIFNVYSPNNEKKVYKRTICNTGQEIGHRKVDIQDKYIFIILPNYVDRYVFEKESELVSLYKEKMSDIGKVVSRNYLMGIGFSVISDINMGNILKYTGADGYFTSPRIIIVATEYEMLEEKKITNVSFDLLKNDIHIESPHSKEINIMRGIFDNIIEGMVLDIVSKQKCITTTHLFNELYKKDYGYKNNTFFSRIPLYFHNLQKLINENSHILLTISCGEYPIEIENSNKLSQNKELTVFVNKDEKDLIENNITKTIEFNYNSEEGLYFKKFKYTNIEGLISLIENIFIVGFQLGVNYEPNISRSIIEKKQIDISRANHLLYDVTIDGKNYSVNAYLRKRKYEDSYFFEWITTPGNIIGSIKTRLPTPYIFKVDELIFDKNFPTDRFRFTFGAENTEALCSLVFEVSNEEEDYKIIINGLPTTLKVRVLKEKRAKPGKIWVWENEKYALVLKVVTENYSQQLKAINNSDIISVINGRVIDKENKKGINNAKIEVEGIKNSTWGDGSFELYLNEKQTLTDNSILLLLDNSGSMDEPLKGKENNPKKSRIAKEAALSLIRNLPKNTEVLFHDFTTLDCENHRVFSFDKKRILDIIAESSWGARTPLTKSVYQTIDLVKKYAIGKNQKVILLSDGENTDKDETMVEAYKKSNYNLPYFTIGFDIEPGSKAEKELKEIADISGGEYIRVENIGELEKAFVDFSKAVTEKKKVIIKANGYKEIQKELALDRQKTFLEFELERIDENVKDKFMVLSKDNLSELNEIKIRNQAKRLINERILADENIRILLPRNMVDYNFVATIGWWEFNVLTGYVVGRTEDGLHGAITIGGAIIGGATGAQAGGMIEKAGALRQFGSFIAGMYAYEAGLLDAALININSLLETELAYIDQHAIQFALSFIDVVHDREYFIKGIKFGSDCLRGEADIRSFYDGMTGVIQSTI